MTRNRRPIFDIVVFMGMTGSGKSYLAARWVSDNGYAYFNTDVERKKLAGVSPNNRCGTGFKRGIYTADFTRLTYGVMLTKAAEALAAPDCKCVVLDGSYLEKKYREQVAAAFPEKAICFVYCFCSERTVARRLATRADDPDAVSDGSMAVYRQQKKNLELPEESHGYRLLMLDTDQPVEYLVDWLNAELTGHRR